MKDKAIKEMIKEDDKILLITMLQEENTRLIKTLQKIRLNLLKLKDV